MKKTLVLFFCLLAGALVFVTYYKFPLYGATVYEGQGEAMLSDGGIYKGSFKDGLFDGSGEIRWPSGGVYKGEFKKGLFDGNGAYRSLDGKVYVGAFKAGNCEGIGKLTFEGGKYEGEFKRSLFSGQGTLKMEDGSEYSGTFLKNKAYGKGVLKRSDGSVWDGIFNGWTMTGQYAVTISGTICSGSFVKGILQGQGKCIYSNGAIYEGEFKDNQPYGEGVMTFKEGLAQHGQVFKGQWKGFKFLGTDEAISEEKHLKGITSLEQRVDEILKMDKVNMRLYIDDVFTLADQYIAEKRLVDADRLLHVALEVDNWRLNYQLKHAQILLALGRRNEAIEKAKRIFTFAENPILIQGAQMLLEKAGEPIKAVPVTIPACTGMTIVLVPMGNVNMQLLKEVIPKLEKIMGIKFVISSQVINEGSLPSGDQLDAEKLVYILAQNFKTSNYPNFTGFLGVTEHDLNTSYTRFVFGTAGNGYGVFSYNRYTAKFNQTKENRVLLVERTVKQAVSSAFLLLDIPRGTNPMSIRSYAHNLFEHDSKPMVVDDWSMGKLDELKSKYCHK